MIPRFKPCLGWHEFISLFSHNAGSVKRFEKSFARVFKSVDAVAFPYGRSAQWAFFKATGIENAEIIMPAYTCSVVAHAITLSGNIPRFIDIKLDDYNMNLDDVELAINENTRAIIATHTFGYPQDLNRLEALVKRAEERFGHKVWLMQDCCHAFGAEWQGRMIGTSGDVAVYAFNISKIITSIFGGILTFQDKELADKIRSWRDSHYHQAHWTKSIHRRLYLLAVYIAFNEKVYGLTWWLQNKTSLLNKFTRAYHLDNQIHFPPDYLDHMTDIEASVGLVQLSKYFKIIERRRKNTLWYDNNLYREEGHSFPPLVEGATYSHYVVRVSDQKKCLEEWAFKGLELGTLIQYSIPLLPCYHKLTSDKFPMAAKASTSMVNYPVDTSSKRFVLQ